MRKQLTLCLVREGDRILLGMKKRGFGAGRWNSFGGKVGPEEMVEAAARRELMEEASIEAHRLEKVGFVTFSFEKNDDVLDVHLFVAREFSGIPTESDEMRPQWFDLNNIPYKDMWPSDTVWLPLVLAGKKLKGSFLLGEGDRVEKQNLEEVYEL